ncbi:MAG: dihydroorotase [Clostridia bacterium]|nr:dihydroorotase [Clostridia bacterium]
MENTKRLLIRGARILNPACGEDYVGNILITGDRVSAVSEHVYDDDAVVIEANGLTAVPGFIDLHVHLRDPGFTDKEDIHTGCKAAAAGGVTSLLCMPNTKPAIDTAETVRYILEEAKTADAHVYVAAAITKGLQGAELCDLEALREAGAVALSDDGRPVVDTACLVEAMRRAPELGMIVAAHCEDLFLAKKWYLNEGETSKALGLPGVPAAAEDCGTAREIAVAAAYDVPVHICHVSTKTSAALIRDAKARGVKVTAETAPHYLLMTDKELLKKDADYRMNPPLRAEEDRIAMIEAIKDGTIDVIATDHAPHTPEEKADFLKAPNGSIGMETSFAGAYTALVKTGVLTLSELVEKMSVRPAEILGIEAGMIGAGQTADIVLIDENEVWTVDADKLHGKSRNTPFKGMELQGKVKLTVCGGRVVYNEL